MSRRSGDLSAGARSAEAAKADNHSDISPFDSLRSLTAGERALSFKIIGLRSARRRRLDRRDSSRRVTRLGQSPQDCSETRMVLQAGKRRVQVYVVQPVPAVLKRLLELFERGVVFV